MKSFLDGDILRGTAVAPHVAWRVCGGPSLTSWGGREVALDKHLLCCAACWAQRGPSFQLGMGNGPRKGPQNPAGHHRHRSTVVQPAAYFSVWVEVPSADPQALGLRCCGNGRTGHVLGRRSRHCRTCGEQGT